MKKIVQALSQVNWDFSDYNSVKYPLDISSIPWYPATFPAPIPKFLIGLLSEPGDMVLDLFGGQGTTIVEAAKQNRRYSYNDLNPFAVDIAKSIIDTIKSQCSDIELLDRILEDDKTDLSEYDRICLQDEYAGKDENSIMQFYPEEFLAELDTLGISQEVIFWFHRDTIQQLLVIYQRIANNDPGCSARKLAFSSVLKDASSQRGHFTYVTDNCRPSSIVYRDAYSLYLNKLDRIRLSVAALVRQFYVVNEGSVNLNVLFENSTIHKGDARDLSWIKTDSIDMVMTSPPYLCAQDYIKTMRLVNMFFGDDDFQNAVVNEIGARNLRRSNKEKVINQFYSDMQVAFKEVKRVLRPEKYFCLVLGQGKGKITQGYDTVEDLIHFLTEDLKFMEVYRTKRTINYKTTRIGGVDKEEIVVLRKV